SRAAIVMHVDHVRAKLDSNRADGAEVNADLTAIPMAAYARLVIPQRRPHVDLAERNWLQRAAGADVHALQPVAKHARHFVRVDIRRAVAGQAGRLDLDTLGRADFNALAAAATRISEALIWKERARRAQPGALDALAARRS